MLQFVVPPWDTLSIANLRERIDEAQAAKIGMLTYDEALVDRDFEPGGYIFAGVEVLSTAERRGACVLFDELALRLPGGALLNDPGRLLRRYDLLQDLHGAGINDHRAWRPEQLGTADPRFPVFVRDEHWHTGSLTGLVHDRDDLERELQRLATRDRYRTEDLLVVEFEDTSDAEGVFRKYSAFRVGDRVFPRSVNFSTDWVVKEHSRVRGNDPGRRLMRAFVDEEMDYLERNPHAELLRPVFERARIDYGRIDNSLREGRIRVWEINTHPQIGPRENPERSEYRAERRALRHAVRETFYRGLGDALAALPGSTPSGGAAIRVVFPVSVATSMAEARAARQAASSFDRLLRIGRRLPRTGVFGLLRSAFSSRAFEYLMRAIRARTRSLHRR